MATISFNGEDFEFNFLDTPTSVKNRYTTKKEGIPQWFVFNPSEFELTEGVEIDVFNLKDYLSNLTFDDLVAKITDIYNSYPPMIKEYIAEVYENRSPEYNLVLLWLVFNNITRVKKIYDSLKNREFLKEIKLVNFRTERRDLAGSIERKIETFKDENKSTQQLIDQIEEYQDVAPYTEIKEEKITTTVKINLPDQQRLIDLFDAVELSAEIPLVSYYFDDKRYYKVYQNILIPEEWLIGLDKQSNRSLNFLLVRQGLRKKKMEVIEWSESNYLTYEYGSGVSLEDVQTSIFSALDGVVLMVENSTRENIKLKVSFNLDGINLDREVTLDLITNNNIVSQFFIVKEFIPLMYYGQQHRKKKVRMEEFASKRRVFIVYYLPIGENIVSAVNFTLKNRVEGNRRFVAVKVNNAPTIEFVEKLQKLLSVTTGVYREWKDDILKDYDKYLPITEKKEEVEVVAKIKKTGQRVDLLREIEPELFTNEYSRWCQGPFQPLIVDEETAMRYDEDYRMEWAANPTSEGRWYVCYDDSKTNLEDVKFPYPGCRPNTRMKNKDKYPLIPCCYKTTRNREKCFQEIAAPISRYREGDILQKNKMAKPGGYAYLPDGLNEFFLQFYSSNQILRYGVPISPNSFLMCLLSATEDGYQLKSLEEKIESAEMIRKVVASDLENPQIAKQECYGWSLTKIKSVLGDNTVYFDPRRFIRITEQFFDCNIFLFDYDKTEGSEVLLPYFSQVYLHRSYDEKRTVVIVVNEAEEMCEVVCERRGLSAVCSFENPDVINNLIEVWTQSNVVYSVTNQQNKLYTATIPFLNEVVSQSIDENGKVRVVKIKDLTLFTSPLPPFGVDLLKESDLTTVNYDSVQKFIERYNFEIISKDSGGVFLRSDYLPFAYLPSYNVPEDIPTSPLFIDPFQIKNKSSLLEGMRINRMIALYLQQYTLFLNSHLLARGEEFGENRFLIEPNHQYNLSLLGGKLELGNNTILNNNRVIVTSDEVRQRLLYYLKISDRNDHDLIVEFKNRKFVSGIFTNLSDFKIREDELIFLSEEGLMDWILGNDVSEMLLLSNNYDPSTITPQFFRDGRVAEGRISLIQNVEDGELGRGLFNSMVWQQNRYNYGYRSLYTDPSTPSYVVYTREGDDEVVEQTTTSQAHVFSENDKFSGLLFL